MAGAGPKRMTMNDKTKTPDGSTHKTLAEYDAEGRAVRANMEKLRALRLAREAAEAAGAGSGCGAGSAAGSDGLAEEGVAGAGSDAGGCAGGASGAGGGWGAPRGGSSESGSR